MRESLKDRGLLLPVITVFAVSSALYLNILPNGFLDDDHNQIAANPFIRDLANIPLFFSSSAWLHMGEAALSNYYRPVMSLIFAVDYSLFGAEPWAYHLTSLFFHSLNSVLVFLLGLKLLRDGEPGALSGGVEAGRSPLWLALGASLLFAAHPVNTEAVAWASAIPELSYSLFYLLSLYFYLSYREGARLWSYIISLGAFLLALFSKEPAITLPLVLISYDLFIRGERVRPLLSWVKRFSPYAVAVAVYLLARVNALGGLSPMESVHAKLGGAAYILNLLPLIKGYFLKLVFPISLNYSYNFSPITSAGEGEFLLSLFVAALLAVTSVWLFRRSRRAFFLLLWIVLPLLPVLYIPAIAHNVFSERYLYLPAAAFSMLAALTLFRVAALGGSHSRRALGVALISLTFLFYGTGTVVRSFDYRSDVKLWLDTVSKNPESGYPYSNLAMAYARVDEEYLAIEAYHKALSMEMFPADQVLTAFNLGNAYLRIGEDKRAAAVFEELIKADPRNYEAMNNLGGILARGGDLDGAIDYFTGALDINPAFADAKRNLELALKLREGR